MEMALTEAKFESAQRSLEADLQAQMEKKVSGCWWGRWGVWRGGGGGGFCDMFYICLSISAFPWQKIACPKVIVLQGLHLQMAEACTQLLGTDVFVQHWLDLLTSLE